MAGPEVKAVENLLGTPVSYAYAVKAGPWIFLNGHEAFDFESGIPEEVAGPAGFPLFGHRAAAVRATSSCTACAGSCANSAPTCRMASGSTSIIRTRERSLPTTWRGMPSSATTFRRAPRLSWNAASALIRRYRVRWSQSCPARNTRSTKSTPRVWPPRRPRLRADRGL